MKRGHRRAKRAAEVTAGTVLVLGLGAVVAGTLLYKYARPSSTPTATPTNPAAPVPTGGGVTAAIGPASPPR